MVAGTRLEQLVVLRDQVTAEIEAERRKDRHNGQPLADIPTSAEALMAVIGTNSHAVKEWAVEQGLLARVARGRVSLAVVQAFKEAHQP